MFVVPTPTALFSNFGMLAIMPGYSMSGASLGPMIAIPGVRGVFLSLLDGVLLKITGNLLRTLSNLSS